MNWPWTVNWNQCDRYEYDYTVLYCCLQRKEQVPIRATLVKRWMIANCLDVIIIRASMIKIYSLVWRTEQCAKFIEQVDLGISVCVTFFRRFIHYLYSRAIKILITDKKYFQWQIALPLRWIIDSVGNGSLNDVLDLW